MRKATAREEAQGPASARLNGSGSYSSIVGSLANQHATDGLTGARQAEGHNPFAYGKEEMLQVYAGLAAEGNKQGLNHAPLDYEPYEQVAAGQLVKPVNLTEPSSEEKALLAGNINSEQKQRRPQQQQDESRLNGRRTGETSRHAGRSQDLRKSSDWTSEDKPAVEGQAEASTREAFPMVSGGRAQSKFASMGVFDTGLNGHVPQASQQHIPESSSSLSKWADDKDDDVLKEAMGYADAGSHDVDRLGQLYAKQSLNDASSSHLQHVPAQSRYVQQSYNPLSNGLPDLFSNKPSGQPAPSLYGQPQPVDPSRYGASGTPSPGLPVRQEPPMTTRVMVMPDKLKWQYRDPTGQNQGPFSGLEMHDWYKAGFFQPNLLVKRQEDEEFEPLSILVRRIGNQREPFLVPLPSRVPTSAVQTRPGTADGTKDSWTNGGAGSWLSNGSNGNGGSTGSAAASQAPFPSSFPSFGTTLTAEQQNALERRKQEEQYLMHRQREFLQQQQLAQQMAAQRYMHGPHAGGYGVAAGQPGYSGMGIGRHGSPFNSTTERPVSYDPNGVGNAGGYNPALNHGAGWQQSSSGPIQAVPATGFPSHQGQQQRGLADFGVGIFDTPRSEVADSVNQGPAAVTTTTTQSAAVSSNHVQSRGQVQELPIEPVQPIVQEKRQSLQQVQEEQQRAAYAESRQQRQQEEQQRAEQAAAAQADQETAFDSAPVTPSASSAPAPWAQAQREPAKSLSLKEIQELEAKRAALRREQERKASMEAQAQLQAQVQHASASTPLNLNWAEQAHVNAPTMQNGVPWKAAATPGKKTLAQIQQEEEAARQRQLAQQQQALAQAGMSSVSLGSRYADTASKPAAPVAPAIATNSGASAWATVGASGKVSAPAVRAAEPRAQPAPAPVPVQRTPSEVAPKKPTQPADPNAISPEFYKWAQSALVRGLNPGVQFEELLQLLLSFGTDTGKTTQEIISDSIYAHSATLDGRRFAEEFCKRRRQELRTAVGKASVQELSKTLGARTSASTTQDPAGASNGGWNDVVKRQKDGASAAASETDGWNAAVKIQGSKKKAAKRH
jgi:PERQ amino acid-rich with GYF domain-containing protein